MSVSKYRKMDKKNHPGRGGACGKKTKVRRVGFYNGSTRQAFKAEIF